MSATTARTPINRAVRASELLLIVAAAALFAPPAVAHATPVAEATSIVLPGATSAEGIAAGKGSTFYAGDLFAGDIFRGNVKTGTAELYIDAPDGRMAVGMSASIRHDLLFVAGGGTGQGYVYDTDAATTVATYQFSAAGESFINDVVVTRGGAWFTDSVQAQLYFVPLDGYGNLGDFRTLALSGPATDTSGEFNLNGIEATPNGSTLIVAHSTNGELYTVDPDDGTSALIAGVSVPNVDGIVLRGHRLWAVRNFANQIARIELNSDLTSGVVEKTITSKLFQIPTTAALFGKTLAAVNAKFDTGLPPTADQYEVILVNA